MERESIDFPSKPFISNEAKDLITQILNMNPEKRPPMFVILGHKWFNMTQEDIEESVRLQKVQDEELEEKERIQEEENEKKRLNEIHKKIFKRYESSIANGTKNRSRDTLQAFGLGAFMHTTSSNQNLHYKGSSYHPIRKGTNHAIRSSNFPRFKSPGTGNGSSLAAGNQSHHDLLINSGQS
jgi:serine/threonine protein kinase